MKKYGRILLVGCVSLAMNATACSEKAAPVDGIICELKNYFMREDFYGSLTAELSSEQMDLSVASNLTRYIAPLQRQLLLNKDLPTQRECMTISCKLLKRFVHLFQRGRNNILLGDRENLELHFKKWQTSFEKNEDFMQNLVDSYNANATDKDKKDVLNFVEKLVIRK